MPDMCSFLNILNIKESFKNKLAVKIFNIILEFCAFFPVS
jgi:hypothetical protein